MSVFFATSTRCNPDASHILYTNDDNPILVKGVDIRKFLAGLGVEVRFLPFTQFKPPLGYSEAFKNAFYKLDVIKALGMEENKATILLDSDCVWTKPGKALEKLIKPNTLLLYDVYKSYSDKKDKHYRTRVGLGSLYKELNQEYPKKEPIQFGGELIAGNSKSFREISTRLEEAFDLVLSKANNSYLRVDDENTIFDGDEFLSSYVYNDMALEYINADLFLKRIWNSLKYSNASESDLQLTIWHIPSEKTQGIPLIFKKVMNKNSAFWQVPLNRFTFYLGGYLGVPKQVSHQRYYMLVSKVFEALLRHVVHNQKKVKNYLLS